MYSPDNIKLISFFIQFINLQYSDEYNFKLFPGLCLLSNGSSIVNPLFLCLLFEMLSIDLLLIEIIFLPYISK